MNLKVKYGFQYRCSGCDHIVKRDDERCWNCDIIFSGIDESDRSINQPLKKKSHKVSLYIFWIYWILIGLSIVTDLIHNIISNNYELSVIIFLFLIGILLFLLIRNKPLGWYIAFGLSVSTPAAQILSVIISKRMSKFEFTLILLGLCFILIVINVKNYFIESEVQRLKHQLK